MPDRRRSVAAHWLANNARAWRKHVLSALRAVGIGIVMILMLVFILLTLLIERIASWTRRLLHSN
jgi:hypothetical protein